MLSPTELLTPPEIDLEELTGGSIAVMGPIEDEDDYYSDLEGDDDIDNDDDDDDDDYDVDDDEDEEAEDDDDDGDDDEDDLG